MRGNTKYSLFAGSLSNRATSSFLSSDLTIFIFFIILSTLADLPFVSRKTTDSGSAVKQTRANGTLSKEDYSKCLSIQINLIAAQQTIIHHQCLVVCAKNATKVKPSDHGIPAMNIVIHERYSIGDISQTYVTRGPNAAKVEAAGEV